MGEQVNKNEQNKVSNILGDGTVKKVKSRRSYLGSVEGDWVAVLNRATGVQDSLTEQVMDVCACPNTHTVPPSWSV